MSGQDEPDQQPVYNKIADYVALARPDHWVKHAFVLPGSVLAIMLSPTALDVVGLLADLLFGLLSACLIASANYVMNEWLDAHSDRSHPVKRHRPAAAGRVSGPLVAVEYFVLLTCGLWISSGLSLPFFVTSVVFALSALVYNAPPLRAKDRAVLDVITESFNNPLRLLLGWFVVSHQTLPPLSALVFYWCGGAFLMTVKRLAEWRSMAANERLSDLFAYRRSFRVYSEGSLTQLSFLYGMLSAFFLGAFLIKYRAEYVVLFPLLALLFTYYLRLGLREKSLAQAPEKLLRDRTLVFLLILLWVTFVTASLVDVPFFQWAAKSEIPVIPAMDAW
jgi:decaprenyl-phosphate phosphoribosyltransferase